MSETPHFRTTPWPTIRNAIISLLRQHRPHTVYGSGEVDVTETLAAIHRLRRELRMPVSFHAVALYCLAQAAQAYPAMHTYRWGRRLVTFDDIDIGTAIDRRLPGGVRIAVGYTVRAAQSKSLAEINWELRRATNIDLAADRTVQLRRKVAALPAPVRWLISRRIRRDPSWLKRYHGTIGLTNLQAPGLDTPFFALPPNIFTCTLALGSIVERVVANHSGGTATRKFLCLAGGVDHAIVDGLTAAGFVRTFARLITSGAGLDPGFAAATRRLMAESAS